MESFVHLRKGTHPAAAARRPGRTEGRRTRPRRVHRPHREHVPPQRPDGVPHVGAAATRRRADQRAQAQRCHRRGGRPDAAVLQCRLPGSAVAGAPSRCRSSSATSTAICWRSCTRAAGLLETEFGPLRYREGDWVYIPKACTCRQVPDSESTLLMIQATDEFRVPPPGQLGRHFPFDPSQVVIPEPQPIDDDWPAPSMRSG